MNVEAEKAEQLFKIASGCDYERSWNNKKC